MIDNPIIKPSDNNLEEYIGQYVFVAHGNHLKYTKPLRVNDRLIVYDEKWSISNGKLRNCAINGMIFDSGALLDFLSREYPDHFEWLLFHPEWLGC